MRDIKYMERRLVRCSSKKLASRSNSQRVDGSVIYAASKLGNSSTVRCCEDSN
jgi:hypothetical protein